MAKPLFVIHHQDKDPQDSTLIQIEMIRDLTLDDVTHSQSIHYVPAWSADPKLREIIIGERFAFDMALMQPLRNFLPYHRSLKAWERGGMSVPEPLVQIGQGAASITASETPSYRGLSTDAQKEAVFNEVLDEVQTRFANDREHLVEELLAKLNDALRVEVQAINEDQVRTLRRDIQGDDYADSWFKQHMTDIERAIWEDLDGNFVERQQSRIDAIVRGLNKETKEQGRSQFIQKALEEGTKDIKPNRPRRMRKKRVNYDRDEPAMQP